MKRFSSIAVITLALGACDSPTTPPDAADPSASVSAAATTFRVTSTADADDARRGDGVCRTRSGVCTVRAAIQEANALAGAEQITVPAGVYPVSLRPLAITGPVTITGAGPGQTVLDGGSRSFRVVIVAAGARGVTLAALTIRNGGNVNNAYTCASDPDRGGVAVEAGAAAVLRLVVLSGNQTGCWGAGVLNSGTLRLDRSTVSGNVAGDL